DGVAAARRRPGVDGLHDWCAAADGGVRVARFCLPGHGVTELLIGVAVGGIEVVAVDALRPLHDVAIEVNHRMTVPAHRRPLPREGTQASWASSDRTPSLFRSAARFCQSALVLTITTTPDTQGDARVFGSGSWGGLGGGHGGHAARSLPVPRPSPHRPWYGA